MDTEEARILELQNQLMNLGYHKFQIESIIKDTVHTNRLDSLTADQSSQLIQTLEEYIAFAARCRRKGSK